MNIVHALFMHLERFLKIHGGVEVSLKHFTLGYNLIMFLLGKKREGEWRGQDWLSFRDFAQVVFIHK